MGYELHITRAEHWSENDYCEIKTEEWLSIINSDPELYTSQANGRFFAGWGAPPELADQALNWRSGNIVATRPDTAFIQKMIQIALKLGAKVQGDEGEIYTGNGDESYFSG